MSTSPKLRIGIIASSGGSVFIETYQILKKYQPGVIDFVVVTDRECGIEEFCEAEGIPHRRISDADNTGFSVKAAEYLRLFGTIDCVLLFYLRLVTDAIYSSFLTINLHPSLLPAYAGFNAIRRLIKDNGKFLGATAHLVNEKVDGGMIVAQTVRPIALAELEEQTLNKISFLQKTYLVLTVIEMLLTGSITFPGSPLSAQIAALVPNNNSNPGIVNRNLLLGFSDLERRENQKMV